MSLEGKIFTIKDLNILERMDLKYLWRLKKRYMIFLKVNIGGMGFIIPYIKQVKILQRQSKRHLIELTC
jgi:hypothetical protein